MYAVIETKWHQYIVSEGDKIVVDKLEWKKWDKINLDTVLSVFEEKWDKVAIWKPYVKSAKVVLQIIETKKWEKISVLKFRRKNRYKRKIGFRPIQTILEVKKIDFNG